MSQTGLTVKCNIKQSRVAAPEKRLKFTTKDGRKQKRQEGKARQRRKGRKKTLRKAVTIWSGVYICMKIVCPSDKIVYLGNKNGGQRKHG